SWVAVELESLTSEALTKQVCVPLKQGVPSVCRKLSGTWAVKAPPDACTAVLWNQFVALKGCPVRHTSMAIMSLAELLVNPVPETVTVLPEVMDEDGVTVTCSPVARAAAPPIRRAAARTPKAARIRMRCDE